MSGGVGEGLHDSLAGRPTSTHTEKSNSRQTVGTLGTSVLRLSTRWFNEDILHVVTEGQFQRHRTFHALWTNTLRPFSSNLNSTVYGVCSRNGREGLG